MKMDLSLIEVRMFTPFLVRKQLVTFRSHALSLKLNVHRGDILLYRLYKTGFTRATQFI